jgi:hypothetical protein
VELLLLLLHCHSLDVPFTSWLVLLAHTCNVAADDRIIPCTSKCCSDTPQ